METNFIGGLRNKFRGPGYWNTDFTVQKQTQIPHWEKGQFGLAFQFFNLFNHPNFQSTEQQFDWSARIHRLGRQ